MTTTSGEQEGVRRRVVVLFANVADFTSLSEGLDPKVLRAVMDPYFRLVSRVILRHGGNTEKYLRASVMAVFADPMARENDALQAVRAAGEILTDLDDLNIKFAGEFGFRLRVRIAVYSGLVSALVNTSGDLRVIGDTINTAGRLQEAAEPGQVLVGEDVALAVRDQVRLEELPPLAVKGKEAPVRCWRVLGPSRPASTGPRGGRRG